MNKTEVKIPEMLFFQEGPGVRNTQYTSSGVKLLNVANLVDGKVDLSTSYRYISEDEAYGKYRHFLCDEGDFIVASSGIKVDYIDKKMGFISREMLPLCMNTSTIRFKVLDDSKLNIKYFMYFLKSTAFKKQLAKQITGSAQLNYGPSHLKQMTFPLIDIKIQNDLVQKLDSIMRIIDQKNTSLKKLDELVKARFVEMFGNNKYETRIIKDVLCESFWLMPATPKYIDEGIPYITSKNIKNRILDLDDTKFISENDYVKISKNRPIKPGDILISMIGTLGQIAVVSKNKRFYGQNVYLLRVNNDIISTSFFCEFFNSDDVQNKLAGKSNQSTQAYLKANHVEDLLIPVPPIVIQNDFAAFAAQVDKSKFALVKSIKLLKKSPFNMLLGLL